MEEEVRWGGEYDRVTVSDNDDKIMIVMIMMMMMMIMIIMIKSCQPSSKRLVENKTR